LTGLFAKLIIDSRKPTGFDDWIDMRRRWLQPVSLISLAAFLIANTPASARAVHCPWVLVLPDRHACEVHGDQDDCCTGCPGDEPADDSLFQKPSARHEPTCPHCPVPSCPQGCCWCSVAKVPMCGGTLQMSAALAPSLGSCLLEASLLIPAAPCGELIRPPRA
jgi:hypothetical protein